MEEISGLWYTRKLNISSIKARTFLTSWGTSNISRRAVLQGFDIFRNNVIQSVIPATNYKFVLQHYYKMFYQILLTTEICLSQIECHLTLAIDNTFIIRQLPITQQNYRQIFIATRKSYFRLQCFHLIRRGSPTFTLSW